MAFKDKKEEVLEIELTAFGKHLLSKGKFKPVYYSFFDDDVIYDWKYSGDSQEEQNYAETRILEETPANEVQVSFSSAEKRVYEQVELVRTGNKELKEAFQATPERHYSLSAPLGKSSVLNDYFPAWQIKLYGSEIASDSTVDQGDQPTLQIPQIDVGKIVYKTKTEKSLLSKGNLSFTPGDSDGLDELEPTVLDFYEDNQEFVRENALDVVVEVKPQFLILEVDEANTEPLTENFDVEVFIVEDEVIDGNTVETLIPLNFIKKHDNIKDGILVDDVEDELNVEDIDETYVEYYFDIFRDKEIEKDLLCELGYRTDFSKRGYLKVECPETKDTTVGEVDIYETNVEDPFGDDC
jgi:hypothetical protein